MSRGMGLCRIAEKLLGASVACILIVVAALCGYTAYDAALVNSASSAEAYLANSGTTLDEAYRGACMQNQDVIGWIRMNGTGISQAIVQGQDNSFYLTHDASGADSFGGACFLDWRANAGFSQGVPVVYGHNMAQGSMLGDVTRYVEESGYLENHRDGALCIQGTWYSVRALCALRCSEKDRAVYDCLSDAGKGSFCHACENLSTFACEHPAPEHRLAALSTCSGNGQQRCVLVIAIENENAAAASSPVTA